jgi:hypothetical protein
MIDATTGRASSGHRRRTVGSLGQRCGPEMWNRGVQDREVGPPGTGMHAVVLLSDQAGDDGTTAAVLEVERGRCDRGRGWVEGLNARDTSVF